MFKNDFQGGPYFEILSAQGKDAANHWKTSGGVKKGYEKEVKSYVFTLEGSPTTTKMIIPKDSKTSMTLVQRFLVLQIFVAKGAEVSIDVGVTDLGNNKRRLMFSTAVKETSITPLHAKLPLSLLKRSVWLNLAIDMVSMVGEGWKGQTYRSMEGLSVSANCKIRKIFTMKNQPADTTDDDVVYDMSAASSGEIDTIPRQCQIAHDVNQATQVLSMAKLRHVELRARGGEASSRATSASEIDLNSSGRRSNNERYHIAFGSKVAAPPPATAARKSTSGREGSRTSRSSHSSGKNLDDSTNSASGQHPPDRLVVDHSSSARRQRLPSDPGSIIEDPAISVDKASLGGSRTWSSPIDRNDETPFKKPHPPREPSSDRVRRKIRIKSGEKKRTSHPSESSDKTGVSPLVSPRKDTAAGPDSVFGSDVAGVLSMMKSSAQFHEPNSNSAVAADDPRPEEENADESISDIISAVRSRMNLDDHDQSKVTEYIESDDEELKNQLGECGDVYIFKSKPTVAPRRTHSPNPADADKMRKSVRSSIKTDMSIRASRGAKPDADFVQSEDDDMEEDLRKKLLRNTPSPRPPDTPRSAASSPSNSAGSQGIRRYRHRQESNNSKSDRTSSASETGISLKDSGCGPTLSVKNNMPMAKSSDSEPTLSTQPDRLSYNSSSDQSGGKHASPENGTSQPPTHRTLASLKASPQRNSDVFNASMNSTASRMSISKKSLREIPKNDARLSQQMKPYDSTKYQMYDLSESFEANMLASLKRQQEDDEDIDAPHDNSNQDDSNHGNNSLEKHAYEDDAMSSSSDDTSYSTWQGPAPTLMAHHYQDEMHLPTSRLSNDPLNMSNPRDWTGVFSPPIVLPSDMAQTQQDFAAHTIELKSPRKHSPDSKHRKRLVSQGDQGRDTDSEDELDLLYDPCLNCYFDPRTCKYYELI